MIANNMIRTDINKTKAGKYCSFCTNPTEASLTHQYQRLQLYIGSTTSPCLVAYMTTTCMFITKPSHVSRPSSASKSLCGLHFSFRFHTVWRSLTEHCSCRYSPLRLPSLMDGHKRNIPKLSGQWTKDLRIRDVNWTPEMVAKAFLL